jgi:hypothetical protein
MPARPPSLLLARHSGTPGENAAAVKGAKRPVCGRTLYADEVRLAWARNRR